MIKQIMKIFAVYILLFTLTPSAIAQDKHHPAQPKPPKISESGLVKRPCLLRCQVWRLLTTIEDIEIIIDVYIKLYFRLKLSQQDVTTPTEHS